MDKIDEETKQQLDLLKSICEVRVGPIRTSINYTLTFAAALMAAELTYAIATIGRNIDWLIVGALQGGVILLLYFTFREMALELRLSKRLREHMMSVVTSGTVIGDFEWAAKEMFEGKPKWIPF